MGFARFSGLSILLYSLMLVVFAEVPAIGQPFTNDRFAGYVADLKTQQIGFFLKDEDGLLISGFKNLDQHLKSKGHELLFAMNGGMFQKNYSPVGWYVENGKQIVRMNHNKGEGNFYLSPNGVFYLTTDKQARVVATDKYEPTENVEFATQSGPMLVIDGVIHSAFNKESVNLNIRNGVGILPDGKVLMAISKVPVNFYDFAKYFLEAGCKNALYLDGFVSRIYSPALEALPSDEKFGVLIGVYK